ncbi:hypothetical protein Dimus_000219 [Dionaea muscipula]
MENFLMEKNLYQKWKMCKERGRSDDSGGVQYSRGLPAIAWSRVQRKGSFYRHRQMRLLTKP